MASDSGTLEQLKELSSRRKSIEESINGNSQITEAVAREISGGLTSRYQQDIQRLENYLPLLKNLVHDIKVRFQNHPIMLSGWISNLRIRWTSSVLSSSSVFHLKGPKFHQVNDIHFELGMTFFLYSSMLRERALELSSSGKGTSLQENLVQSATLFRKAAGVYEYLSKDVLIGLKCGENMIPEATSNISSVMSLVCLADAQALTARKSEENGNSSSLLAKLNYGITEFLTEATEILQATIKDCKDISPRLMDYITSCNTLHELKCYKHFAENLKNEGEIGAAIGGVLRQELSKANKREPKDGLWRLVMREVAEDLRVVLRKYEHENEFVWHQKIPSKIELPVVQAGLKTVSSIPYQPQKWEKTLLFKF